MRLSCLAMLTILSMVTVANVGGAHGRAGGGRAPHGGARRRGAADASLDPARCANARGAAAYGSTARCLRALCAGQNVTNAYVLDGAHRLLRNPCAGVDPFDGGR